MEFYLWQAVLIGLLLSSTKIWQMTLIGMGLIWNAYGGLIDRGIL